MDREAWHAAVHGVTKSWTQLSDWTDSGKESASMQDRGDPSLGREDTLKQPAPGFLPGESHGQRKLSGYSPSGCKELSTTEYTHVQNILCVWPCFHIDSIPPVVWQLAFFAPQHTWIWFVPLISSTPPPNVDPASTDNLKLLPQVATVYEVWELCGAGPKQLWGSLLGSDFLGLEGQNHRESTLKAEPLAGPKYLGSRSRTSPRPPAAGAGSS